MSRHLEEHELTAAVAGLELDQTARDHLRSCLSCRRQVTAIRRLLDQRRELINGQAPDWDRQQQEILAQLPPPRAAVVPIRRQQWLRPLLAAAAVILLAVGIGSLYQAPGSVVPGTPIPTDELAVEEILAEVDAILAADGIPGFEALGEIIPNSDEIGSYYFENGAS
jgi:predicted anti-sigma-YlaC factor YlaD